MKLFISGMFRSGTTLLARMLNSHPSICVASDPFASIFKSFRNEIAIEHIGSKYDKDSPYDDYYYSNQHIFTSIQKRCLELPLVNHNIDEIQNKIKIQCKP